MRVTHITTNDTGGAGAACVRLSGALREHGVESRVLALHARTSLPDVVAYTPSIIERIRNTFIRIRHRRLLLPDRERSDTFSFPDSGFRIHTHPLVTGADILNLHWTAFFLDYESFFNNIQGPVVWTLHDMGPFGSGNHYTEPSHVRASDEKRILDAKLAVLTRPGINLTIVSPSRWLLEKSKASLAFGRFRHVHIPNGVDGRVFRAHDQAVVRTELGLDPAKKVLLFVAESIKSERKGFHLLLDALDELERSGETPTLCVVGTIDPSMQDRFKDMHSFGYVRDPEQLSKIYAAADFFVLPSVEDNLPNTMLESLMCGTPVIGFPVGGIGESIKNGANGMLCETIGPRALADTVRLALQHPFDRTAIGQDARAQYDLPRAAEAYATLYKSLLT